MMIAMYQSGERLLFCGDKNPEVWMDTFAIAQSTSFTALESLMPTITAEIQGVTGIEVAWRRTEGYPEVYVK